MENSNFRGCAILIGINEYEDEGLGNLQNAEKDATKLFDHLTQHGYSEENIILLTGENATKTQILNAFNEIYANLNSDTPFIFFFAGHGCIQNTKDADDYSCPLCNYSQEDNKTYLSKHDILKLFNECNSERVLFLLDCCMSGELARGKDAPNIDNAPDIDNIVNDFVPNSPKKGHVLIASSLPDQCSYEINGGIFTHCLLNGLKGEGQEEMSTEVKVLDLAQYLLDEVPRVARKYKIEQQCCIKTSVLHEDFSICKKMQFIQEKNPPQRYFNAVILLDESQSILDNVTAAYSNANDKTMASCFAYQGDDVARSYIRLVENKDGYSLNVEAEKLLKANIQTIVNLIIAGKKKIRIISLGIGNGNKDGIIIENIFSNGYDGPLDYCVVDSSREMMKLGLQKVLSLNVGGNEKRINRSFYLMDFLDIDDNDIKGRIGNDRCNLFLLLGNTLGNYDESTLLAKITDVMHPGDWLLVDNELKKKGHLSESHVGRLMKAYNGSACREYIQTILNHAGIMSDKGTIKTKIVPDKETGVATVKEIFKATENFRLSNGFLVSKGTSLTVLYSKKYPDEYFNNLFQPESLLIERDFSQKSKYALVLAQKPYVQ